MLCVNVAVNGAKQVIAGDPLAESIEATVGVYPGLKECWLRIVGTILPDAQPPADAQWAGLTLKVGDVVEIRIIDSASAAAPNVGPQRHDTYRFR